jgi:hypothetical protein
LSQLSRSFSNLSPCLAKFNLSLSSVFPFSTKLEKTKKVHFCASKLHAKISVHFGFARIMTTRLQQGLHSTEIYNSTIIYMGEKTSLKSLCQPDALHNFFAWKGLSG